MGERIKYKVITKDGRRSTNSFITKMCSKYVLQYLKGEVVKALPDTIGILVFKQYNPARSFQSHLERSCNGLGALEIIKVIPIGEKSTPKYISRSCGDDGINKFYHSDNAGLTNAWKGLAPNGTECYPAVEVLQ